VRKSRGASQKINVEVQSYYYTSDEQDINNSINNNINGNNNLYR